MARLALPPPLSCEDLAQWFVSLRSWPAQSAIVSTCSEQYCNERFVVALLKDGYLSPKEEGCQRWRCSSLIFFGAM